MVARFPTIGLAIALFSIAVSAAPVRLRVTGNRVNLRARPVLEAEVVGQVSTGELLLPVDSLTEGSEWIKVRPPDEVDLWIYSQLLTDGIVNANNTLVRGGPGLQFKPVGKVPKGTKVVIRLSKGDWTSVAPIPGYCELWIHSDFVKPVAPVRPPSVVSPKTASAEKNPGGSAGATAVVGKPPVEKVPVPSSPPALASSNVVPVSVPIPKATIAAQKPKTIPRRQEKAVEGLAAAGSAPRVDPPSAMVQTEVDVAPEVLPITDVPSMASKPEPLRKPRVPASLSSLPLDRHYHQGEASVLRGRLCKVSSAFGASPARYQLVENSSTVCRLVGCVGQWDELVRSEVEVRGTLWMLAGDPVPVLHVVRADRLASWGE